MSSPAAELTLGRPSNIVKHAPFLGRPRSLEQYLKALEDERKKIEVFKRELPFCMQILTNAIKASKEQLADCQQPPLKKRQLQGGSIAMNTNREPILEEFMPLKNQDAAFTSGREDQSCNGVSPPFGQDGVASPFRGSGVVFNPLKGPNHKCKDLANAKSSGHSCNPSQRKPRRCWSPELHRRFVKALQQLGGSQVATPKQIRELMKVDGLTNDEVKSHLQKYRLHTRRPSHGFQLAGPPPHQLVVVGGIWVPPEYAASTTPPISYNDPSQEQAPHNFHQQTFSQNLYTQLDVSSPHLQMNPSLYCDAQQATGSSQGPLQLAGHSSDAGREDSIEDANEFSSWKGECQEERFDHEAAQDKNGDSYEGSLPAHKWRYGRDSEGDSEAEDSRVCLPED